MSDEPKSLAQSAEHWLGVAALVAAPTSLITGLCYFYGLLFIHDRLHYFGVDPSMLGYTSADYALTTIRVFFFASLRVLIFAAALVVLMVAVRRWAASNRRITLLRSIAWLSAAAGVAGLMVAGVWLVSEDSVINLVIKDAPPIYMAGVIVAGIALLVAGYWVLTLTGGVGKLGRLPRVAERIMFVLAVIGLVVASFWVTRIYASDQGKSDAGYAAGNLWPADAEFTAVQLDTPELLGIPGTMVKKTTLPAAPGPPTAPTYRYQCLRILEAHGGRYVLVPARWSRESGFAITVTPDATHRLTSIVNSTPVAKGGTVDDWQCPEVVRIFQASDLESVLLTPDAAGPIAGAALSINGPDTTASAHKNTTPTKDCVPEHDLETTPESRERVLHGEGIWMRQRTMVFPNPADAENFLADVHDQWGTCAGKLAQLNRPGGTQPRTLGGWGIQENILSIPDSASGSADCAQAMTAKSNIVIAVDMCGRQPERAIAVAFSMRNHIPTDY